MEWTTEKQRQFERLLGEWRDHMEESKAKGGSFHEAKIDEILLYCAVKTYLEKK